MKTKRVAVLGVFLESNAFAALYSKRDFEARVYLAGEAVSTDARSNSPRVMREVVGFYRYMDQKADWEAVPLLVLGAGAGGPVDDGFIGDIIAQLRCHIESVLPVDGVYIVDHGAMTTPKNDDIEGDLISMVRETVGPDIPIVVTWDLHANLSQKMIDSVNAVVSYRTDPHVDHKERGAEAAAILLEIFDGLKPVVKNIRLPIIPPNISLSSQKGPFGDLIQYGRKNMAPDILNVSILAGFAYSDTKKNGLHIVITAKHNSNAARDLCMELARRAWADRHRFNWDGLVSLEAAVKMAVETGVDASLPPLLMADLGDNPGAGGPGSTMWMLEGLYQAGARGALIGGFCDPRLNERALDAGTGSNFEAVFQGDDWGRSHSQLVAPVSVLSLHNGRCTGRHGVNAGRRLELGLLSLLELGSMMVVVSSRPILFNDPVMAEMLGLDISKIRTLVVKLRSTYRSAYDEFFLPENMLKIDTPGRTSPVLSRFEWKNLPRPVWPIDRDFQWSVPDPEDYC
jgi:microcystin degradation protein MlrC